MIIFQHFSTAIGVTPTPFRELTDWSIDHLHLTRSRSGNRYVIAAVDRFSKYLVCQPVESLSQQTCASFLRLLFTLFPDAASVYGDNAFDNVVCDKICKENNVQLDYTASNNSRSNNVERQNGTIRPLLDRHLKAENGHPDDWDLYLPRICQAYNQTPHVTTKISPYRLVLNKIPTLLTEQFSTESLDTLRVQVHTRLRSSKNKYSAQISDKIRILPHGTEIHIRYSAKSTPIRAKILQDFGFTAKIQKYDKGRYSVIRVAKRHIFEIIHVNNMILSRFAFRVDKM